jgi:hypothetical protein
MASNTTLNTGSGGDVIATKERTHDGDATKVQVVALAGVSGTEGSYTFGDIGGDATNGLDVDVTRSALPTGASTSANQTTIIGHLDGVEGLLTTIDADTGAMLTSLQTIDNAISGNEMQVDIVSGGITGVVDDSAFTPGTTETVAVGFFADETSPDSVNEGDLGAARMSLDRKQYVIAHAETSSIYQNGTARTPTFAVIDAATSGDNTLVAAAGAGNKIRVHALYLVAAGTVNARFESGASGTALSGQMNLVANTGFVLPFNPVGWFETAANTLLNLELSAAVSVDGSMVYTVVT